MLLRRACLVSPLLIAGCDNPRNIDFRITDHAGEPVANVIVDCWGTVNDDGDPETAPQLDPPVLSRHSDTEFSCDVDWSSTGIRVTAETAGGAFASVSRALTTETTAVPDLVVWRPQIAVVEIDDQLVVTWDPAAPADPDWSHRLLVSLHPDAETVTIEGGLTTAMFSRELLVDLFSPSVTLSATASDGEEQGGLAITPRVAFEATPVIPPSRGLACETLQVEADGATATVPHPAGACPLTDGRFREIDCGSVCDVQGGTFDLGALVEVRRVRLSCEGSTFRRLELSQDGARFEQVPIFDPLPAPISARYVRTSCGNGPSVHATEVAVVWSP